MWTSQEISSPLAPRRRQVCGGYCGALKLRSAERFDVLEESWEKLPMMLEANASG
jgi:hypothetical protein